MTNVQEALNNTLVMLDVLTVEFGITGLEPLIAEVKAALFEIEKCESVGVFNGEFGGIVEGEAWFKCNTNKSIPKLGSKLYEKPQPREWVDVSDSFITKTIWENTKLNPNIQDDAETLLYVTNAVKAILAEAKQLNTKG